MGFNTYGSKTRAYGGGVPVWFRVRQQERCGAKLSKLPVVGTVLPAGTLVSVDQAGGTATVIKTFEVAAAVSSADTTVKVKAGARYPLLEQGDIVMKAPTTLTGTGKAVAVGEVTEEEDGTLSFTITANDLGTLAAGDVLTIAASAGASKTMAYIPTGLTFNDVYVEEGDTAATIASVFDGEIMEDRIQPVPAAYKAALPQIKFTKGV